MASLAATETQVTSLMSVVTKLTGEGGGRQQGAMYAISETDTDAAVRREMSPLPRERRDAADRWATASNRMRMKRLTAARLEGQLKCCHL